MFFDGLLIFLLFFIFFLILLSIVFYQRIRVRDYFLTNNPTGTAITFQPTTDNYFTIRTGPAAPDLQFIPINEDRKRTIRGRLVLLTYTTNTTSEFYRIRVMDGTKKLSEAIYRIEPQMCYNSINFTAPRGDRRILTIDVQKYNPTTQNVINTAPTNINLVKAYGWYY
jgi:hypothetical protein